MKNENEKVTFYSASFAFNVEMNRERFEFLCEANRESSSFYMERQMTLFVGLLMSDSKWKLTDIQMNFKMGEKLLLDSGRNNSFFGNGTKFNLILQKKY